MQKQKFVEKMLIIVNLVCDIKDDICIIMNSDYNSLKKA